jgi:hypothetical protein
MTLVPIVYTSLIIFASLLTFVIISSYIAFKAKSGSRMRPNIEEAQLGYIPRPILVNNIPLQRESNRVQTRLIPQNYVPKPTKTTPYQAEIKYKTMWNIESQKSKQENAPRKHKSSQYSRMTKQIDRIEIMNNTERFRRTSEFDNVSLQPSGTISDSNLLNYYSDRADTNIDFTVMNANYLRKAL